MTGSDDGRGRWPWTRAPAAPLTANGRSGARDSAADAPPRQPAPPSTAHVRARDASTAGGIAHANVGTTPAGSLAPLSHRLMSYLQDVATHPYSAALERDHRLGLSEYQGVDTRRRLVEAGIVEAHGVSTGRRSGRLRLLRVTTTGVQHLEAGGFRAELVPQAAFLRRFYVQQLAQFAAYTWPDATIAVSPTRDPADARHALTILKPTAKDAGPDRSIAFQVLTDGSLDLQTLAEDLKHFDEVYLWTETSAAAKAAQRDVQHRVTSSAAERVTCTPIASCLSRPTGHHERPPDGRARPRSRTQRSRPATPLIRQLVRAFGHLHDLDRLDESPLVALEIVQESMNRLSPMPEAQALRALLVEAATRAAHHASEVPTQEPLRHFLEQYLKGKSVTEIAAELGVSREWCSRAYRKQALEIAALQCERMIVLGTRAAPTSRT